MTNEREHRIEYQIHTKLYMWFMHASTPTTLTFMRHFSYMRFFTLFFFQLFFFLKFQKKNNNLHNSCKEHAQQPSTTLHMEFFSFIYLSFICHRTHSILLRIWNISNLQLLISTLCSVFIFLLELHFFSVVRLCSQHNS